MIGSAHYNENVQENRNPKTVYIEILKSYIRGHSEYATAYTICQEISSRVARHNGSKVNGRFSVARIMRGV